MSDKYGWQAIADCPGVPCNKPECIYYDQPDDFTWTCSIPRIQDVAAALVAANARADEAEAQRMVLARRLSLDGEPMGRHSHFTLNEQGEATVPLWLDWAAREAVAK